MTNYRDLTRMSLEAKTILRAAMNRFQLDRDGIHGVAHWGRVRANGFRLAPLTGANVRVVELFALIHDSCRIDDGPDSDHGLRAAGFAEELAQRGILRIGKTDLELLTTACRWHSHGAVLDNATINTCWDADRLDLGRIGVRPDPHRLCTDAAKTPDILRWAHERSLSGAARN